MTIHFYLVPSKEDKSKIQTLEEAGEVGIFLKSVNTLAEYRELQKDTEELKGEWVYFHDGQKISYSALAEILGMQHSIAGRKKGVARAKPFKK